jgi:hypothetical protein
MPRCTCYRRLRTLQIVTIWCRYFLTTCLSKKSAAATLLLHHGRSLLLHMLPRIHAGCPKVYSDDDLKCSIQRRCPSGLARAIAFWFFCCILHSMYTPPAAASVAACWQLAHAHASASSQRSHGLIFLSYSISVPLSLRLLQRDQLPWSCQREPSTTE